MGSTLGTMGQVENVLRVILVSTKGKKKGKSDWEKNLDQLMKGMGYTKLLISLNRRKTAAVWASIIAATSKRALVGGQLSRRHGVHLGAKFQGG